MTAPDEAALAIEAVFRIERARLIASLARITRDLGRAEDLAQDALVAASAEWSKSGVPGNPGAWLLTVARRRAIDELRRHKLAQRKHEEWAREMQDRQENDPAEIGGAIDDAGDALLDLIFTACHPDLPLQSRAALTLRVIGGLTTEEIARAFLSSETAIAQRIVRAKRFLAATGATFEIPGSSERRRRFASVFEVVYLMFNEGYAATSGEHLVRLPLCAEAQRLGRILVNLAPEQPDAFGLLALMELQASRLRARVAHDGSLVPLPEQDRARWDRMLIRRGFEALRRVEQLGGGKRPYVLQASIAACHARAQSADETDWVRIAGLYDALLAAMPSPVVELNRAIAHSMAFGPDTGLALIAKIAEAPALRNYAPLPAAKGDFLLRAGRPAAARIEFERAAGLTRNLKERSFLLGRVASCR